MTTNEKSKRKEKKRRETTIVNFIKEKEKKVKIMDHITEYEN